MTLTEPGDDGDLAIWADLHWLEQILAVLEPCEHTDRDSAGPCVETVYQTALIKLFMLEELHGVDAVSESAVSTRLAEVRVRARALGVLDADAVLARALGMPAIRRSPGRAAGAGTTPNATPPSRAPLEAQPWAVLELHMSTVIGDGDDDARSIAARLRAETDLAPRRIRAFVALTDAGWTMDRPVFWLDPPGKLLDGIWRERARRAVEETITEPLQSNGFLDFDLCFRKRFPEHEAALCEVTTLALHGGDDNWVFGWNEQPGGTVEWRTEIAGTP